MEIYEGEAEDLLFKSEYKVSDTMPTTLLTELDGLGGNTEDLYWVPKEQAGGKEKTYVYDTKIKVVFKVKGIDINKKTIHSVKGASIEVKTGVMEVASTYGYYEPDLNGFDLDNTYIIYYSADCTDFYDKMTLKEYLDQGKPQTHTFIKNGESVTYYFHDYKSKEDGTTIWGNVKTMANGLEAWWVWIPRYAYILDAEGQKVDAVFTNTSNDSLNLGKPFLGSSMGEYIPHTAFTLQEGEETKELKGIWMAKYQASMADNGDFMPEEGQTKYYTPKLTGYNVNSTYIATYNADGTESGNRYLLKDVLADGFSYEEDGVLISGKVDENKFKKVDEYWYDYEKKIWGNIITTANGLKAWWVWIPRYAYYLDSAGAEVDVVFITTKNRLFNGGRELGLYTPHSAFTLQDGTELEGIWMAKYQASMADNGSKLTENGALKYYKPKLTGYNINSTEIVTYKEDGTETGNKYLLKDVLKEGYKADENGVLISGEVDESLLNGEYWYDYDKKIWGNIVTNAHDLEAWWVWIPRYAYYLDEKGAGADVVFITTENKLFNGSDNLELYTPHSAFTLKDGTELEGIWMAKYQASGTFDAGDENITN